jgi:hypothetical protein
MPTDANLSGLTAAERRMVSALLPTATRMVTEEVAKLPEEIEPRITRVMEGRLAVIAHRIDRLIRGDVKRKRT